MKKNEPLVSIIVPVYNVEKYLEECIKSVINQSYKNIELIMIDDGSTDKSLSIMKKYEKKYKNIFVYKQENDEAPGKARNEGINNSKGTYIFFLDADDYLHKNAIEILINNFDKDIDLVIGRTIWTDGNETWYPLREKKLSYKNNIIDMKKCSYYTFEKLSYLCSGRLYKKKIIDKNKIEFPRKYSSQDTYFSIFYNLNCKKIKIITDEIYYRRERCDKSNKSLVQTVTPKSIYGRLKITEMIVKDLIKNKHNKLSYYYANVGVNSNFNRIENIKEFKNIFLDYFKFYDKHFSNKFISTKILLKEINNESKNKLRSYINITCKICKGKINYK